MLSAQEAEQGSLKAGRISPSVTLFLHPVDISPGKRSICTSNEKNIKEPAQKGRCETEEMVFTKAKSE